MRAEQDVLRHIVQFRLFHEERVLHVAGGMVGGKVHLGEHMQVVFHLRSVGQHESHAREYVDDFVPDDGQRMACAHLDGVGRARQVDVVVLGFCRSRLFAKRVNLVEGSLFQLVDFNTHGLLLVGSHVAEVGHQGVDFTFLAEVLQSELFNFLCIRGGQSVYFFQKCFYFL